MTVSNDTVGLWPGIADGSFTLGRRDVDGIGTRVLEAGDPTAPPLIFLHGSGGHLEAYLRNIVAHAAEFHVYAIDMLGHGYTDKPDHDYEIPHYVAHLLAFMDSVGIERAHISGESLGGWVAAQFAMDHPNRIAKLVLNTAGGIIADPAVMERVYSLSLAAVRDASRETVRKRLEFLMADPASVTEDLVDMRYRIYTQPGFDVAMEHIVCLQLPEQRQANMLSESALAAITAPTLVLWTSHDPTAAAEVGKRFADAIDGARFVVMQDCGHWPQFEDPDTFNDIHIGFLTEA